MTGIEPLSPRLPLIDEVAHKIRAAILDGTFQAGQQIFQADVARRLQVSRGPVREALRYLMAEGLVREESRRGTFVVRLDREDVREIYDLRVGLEVRASQLVLRGDLRSVKENMQDALETLTEGIANTDAEAIARADAAFHEHLCRASGNKRLLHLWLKQAAVVRHLIRIDEGSYLDLHELIEEHRSLMTELRAGNEQRFAGLLTQHIEDARDRLIAVTEGRAARTDATTWVASSIRGVGALTTDLSAGTQANIPAARHTIQEPSGPNPTNLTTAR